MACAVAQLTPISLGSSSAWATCTCWRSSGPCICNTKVSVGLAEPCSDHRLRLLRVLIMPDGPWLSVACVSLSLSSCFTVNRADYQRSRAPLNPLPAFKKQSFVPIIITTTAFCRYQVAQIWPWMYTEIGWLRWWCVCVCLLVWIVLNVSPVPDSRIARLDISVLASASGYFSPIKRGVTARAHNRCRCR